MGRGTYSADIAQRAILRKRGRQGKKKQTVYTPLLAYVVGKLNSGDLRNKTKLINVREPWMAVKVIVPSEYLGELLPVLYEHEAETG